MRKLDDRGEKEWGGKEKDTMTEIVATNVLRDGITQT